jgi:hypothetical protein
MIDDQKMVAHFIEAADVAPNQSGLGIGYRATFLKKNREPKLLRFADF